MAKQNLSCFQLVKKETEFPRIKITSSKVCYDLIRQFYFDDIEIYESFFLLLLNSSATTIGFAKISQGGITGTVVDIRIIAKYCIDSLAVSCVLAHNHPSGGLKASQMDIDITKRIKKGLELLDIKVLDHIILTDKEYLSMMDKGLMS